MKKKNLLMMALSLCMVAVIAVGGTLAYMTATDTKLTNTFTFAENISVSLWETEPVATGNEDIQGNQETGFSYTNVVPGQTLNKKPEVSVTTSVDTYVFVKVTPSTNVSVVDYNTYDADTKPNGWKKLTGVEGVDNVWYKEQDGTGTSVTTQLGEIFSHVKVTDQALSGGTTVALNPITIEVAAIQAEGFTDAAAAYPNAVFQTAQGE